MDREEKYIKNLQTLIRKETISSLNDIDLTKFREFHEILKETFPNLFKVVDVKDFDGSLLLTWEGKDKTKNPIMFMNHHDVVEATGKWISDPFEANIIDGKMYGRGTLDTKGGLFAMLEAADELIENGYVPNRTIYFESACTEETTGHGADIISNWMLENNIKLDMVFDEGGMVMYDPIGGAKGTFAMVGMGEKGCADLKFIARSNGGHASTPVKNTPLVRLGKFMEEVDKKNIFKTEMSDTIKEMFGRILPYMVPLKLGRRFVNFASPLLKKILPSFSATANALLKTTIAFTMAGGSNGTNVLPEEAYVIGNMRFSHHEGGEHSIEAVRNIAKKYDIELEILDPGFESRICDYKSSAFKLVEEACFATLKEIDKVVPYIMNGASDSRYFDRVCDSCIRFLPFKIDEQQLESIHGLNENIDISNLVPAVEYYTYLMTNC